jgi:hypothetical protein
MNEHAPPKRFPIVTAMVLTGGLFLCSIYANLSFLVSDPANYQFFPPFERHNGNHNEHLGAEYFNIAQALVRGEGFASPWGEPTGPTAWMPPVLPTILATLLWVSEDDKDFVMAMFIFMQVYIVVGTGVLLIAIAAQTTSNVGAAFTAVVYFLSVMLDFHHWFQFTHDYPFILAAVDLLIAGYLWFRPFADRKTAVGWGIFGGFCALINPIVAFAWCVVSLVDAYRQRAWKPLGFAMLAAALTLAPWTIRNLYWFGRLIPVKSNAAYELYQTQCLQKEGLLKAGAFGSHPYASNGRERAEYKTLGEMAFLDKKKELFWKAVWEDPEDFLDRVASRFLGTTLWYVPFDRGQETARPWTTRITRLTYPLPFLALLVLAYTAVWRPLHPIQWMVMGVYLVYLMPYIAISYYDRYAMPLLGVKTLLIIWGVDRVLALVKQRTVVAVPAVARATPPPRVEKTEQAVAPAPARRPIRPKPARPQTSGEAT